MGGPCRLNCARKVIAMRCLGLLLLPSLLFANMENVLFAQHPTALTVTRLYTGQDRQSHFERVMVKLAPGWAMGVERSDPLVTTKAYVVKAVAGYFSDWHNADVRRYVITISGRAEIEVANGERFVAAPGQVIFAEDLTGKGHTFRVIGDTDWIAMFVDMGR
jgi:quercetin dioxygenase-like cupin family protein